MSCLTIIIARDFAIGTIKKNNLTVEVYHIANNYNSFMQIGTSEEEIQVSTSILLNSNPFRLSVHIWYRLAKRKEPILGSVPKKGEKKIQDGKG